MSRNDRGKLGTANCKSDSVWEENKNQKLKHSIRVRNVEKLIRIEFCFIHEIRSRAGDANTPGPMNSGNSITGTGIKN